MTNLLNHLVYSAVEQYPEFFNFIADTNATEWLYDAIMVFYPVM